MIISRIPGTNLHLDEGMEMGIIMHTKLLCTSIVEILQRSPAFVMIVASARSMLERNLRSSRIGVARNYELQNTAVEKSGDGFIVLDDNKRTASNVLVMYRFLTEREWLVKEHRASE